jgi:phenylpropionate dioxygenase-like ring-hydroxylating dioxygenase large terminal subunit
MLDKVNDQSAIDKMLLTGIRNRWWCIGPSGMFQREPVALTRLGHRLVAWRGADGRLNLVEDRCPHRGLALSLGRVVETGLACRYHGVCVDGHGVVTSVPGLSDCKLVGQKLIKSYPVVEHFQGVWAYFGDESHPEPVALQLPEELLSPEWTGLVFSNTWHANYQYVFDNTVDVMHPRFLHEQSYSMGIDEMQDFVDVKQTADGLIVTRRNDTSNIEGMQFVDSGTMYVRVGVSMPPAIGPGGLLRIIATVVPIDEHNCQLVFWRLRRIQNWQGAMYRFMFNMIYDTFTWEVMEQDREAVEAMPPWPAQEHLYQHDVGVARLRRYMRAEAGKQIAAMSSGN